MQRKCKPSMRTRKLCPKSYILLHFTNSHVYQCPRLRAYIHHACCDQSITLYPCMLRSIHHTISMHAAINPSHYIHACCDQSITLYPCMLRSIHHTISMHAAINPSQLRHIFSISLARSMHMHTTRANNHVGR